MPHAAAQHMPLPPGARRRPVPRWIGPVVAVGLVFVLAVVFRGAYWDVYQLRRETAELMREREMLRRQNAQLREEIRLLNTPEYIERIAREQLGLVRPDEMAIILVRPTPVSPPSPTPAPEPEAPPWWTRLLRWTLD